LAAGEEFLNRFNCFACFMGLKQQVDEILTKVTTIGPQGKNLGAGIDISDSSLKVLLLEKKSGKIEAAFCSAYDFGENVVSDGKILNKEAVGQGLSKIKKEAQDKGQNIEAPTMTIPESKTFLHVFKLSATQDKKRLKEAVVEKAKNLIPFRPSEVYFDFLILDRKEGLLEVLYAACPKKIADDYLEVAKMAGLDIGALDMEAESLARALVVDSPNKALIFDCGSRTTTLTIYDRGGVRSISNLSIAGRAFTKSIAENLDLDFEKAEAVKKEDGLQKKKIEKALDPVLNSVYKQVRNYLNDYQAKSGSKIETIVACGGSVLLPGFIDHMTKSLDLDIKRAKPFEKNSIRVRKDLLRGDFLENSLMHATVVGSALRAIHGKKEAIDFLPKSNK